MVAGIGERFFELPDTPPRSTGIAGTAPALAVVFFPFALPKEPLASALLIATSQKDLSH